MPYYPNINMTVGNNQTSVPFYWDKNFYYALLLAAVPALGLALMSRFVLGKRNAIFKVVGLIGSTALAVAAFYSSKYTGEFISNTIAPKETTRE